MRLSYRTLKSDIPVPVFGGLMIRLKNTPNNSVYYCFAQEFIIGSPVVFGITLGFIHLHRSADQLKVGDLFNGGEIVEITRV